MPPPDMRNAFLREDHFVRRNIIRDAFVNAQIDFPYRIHIHSPTFCRIYSYYRGCSRACQRASSCLRRRSFPGTYVRTLAGAVETSNIKGEGDCIAAIPHRIRLWQAWRSPASLRPCGLVKPSACGRPRNFPPQSLFFPYLHYSRIIISCKQTQKGALEFI